MTLEMAFLVFVLNSLFQIVTMAVAYGHLKQKLEDTSERLERIERWIDNFPEKR